MVDALKLLALFLALVYLPSSDAFRYRKFRSPYNPKLRNALPSEFSYKTMYMTQNVDHFGFDNTQTYQQRYLVSNQFWNDDGGPIFFYTGNEGDIAWFCNNTGFMWDTAPEFKALLVFAEHRYYGESLPYGKDSYANNTMLNYLTAEQAMADFAELIKFIKQTVPGAAKSQVITMGGSYGGMLSAWMRLKYPNLVLGSLAASAPIWQFEGLAPCGSFYEVVQRTFQTGSQQCVDNIAYSWGAMTSLWPVELDFLTKTFDFCKPIESKDDLSNLLDWLAGVYGNMAMVDYPYPASFLEPLPAWPVKEFCKHLSEPLKDKALIAAVAEGVKMYFNYTGQASCINMSEEATGNLGDQGWGYQACTEMVMPMCSNNTNMFYNIDWDFSSYAATCKYEHGVMPRENWISLNYWGKDIKAASNIIFSNGLLDPWSGGGVLESLSPSLVAIQIPSGAHHLDLRGKNPGDPADVIAARQQEKNIMKNWLYGPGR
ncbi:lysosomal Pro-X carboxypeptidase-like isoform X1 [Littorina saxatilis]|uniref:Lysosomal Pro-X carboxypeptidase n=2 Tax=Littorina saxatilis TaxID=31220 RepID=A0AAN9G716_9CAEN